MAGSGQMFIFQATKGTHWPGLAGAGTRHFPPRACQTASVLTWGTFSAFAQGLLGPAAEQECFLSRAGRPDRVHPGPGLSVRLPPILSHQGSESPMKIPQWTAVTLQSRKRDVYRPSPRVGDATRSGGKPAGLGALCPCSRSDSVTGSVTLNT